MRAHALAVSILQGRLAAIQPEGPYWPKGGADEEGQRSWPPSRPDAARSSRKNERRRFGPMGPAGGTPPRRCGPRRPLGQQESER